MKNLPIFTVRDPELSRWQSFVEAAVANRFPELTTPEIRNTNIVQGCWLQVKNLFEGIPIPDIQGEFDENNVEHIACLLNHYFTTIKENPDIKDKKELEAKLKQRWPFSSHHPIHWTIHDLAIPMSGAKPEDYRYRDWKDEQYGGGNIQYGTVKWEIPNNAKIMILGDWGTGNNDAHEFFNKMIQKENIDCIIHLGDVYYSGTKKECREYFYNIIRGKTDVPVFTIPGNHEYYSYMAGFDYLIDTLNYNIPTEHAHQKATYFCLRTEDQRYQFLGLDTGYHDRKPAKTLADAPAPRLKSHNDNEWAIDKIENFPGKTIMLTHHQVFSRSTKLTSDEYGNSYANPHLLKHFSKYFGNKIVAWYWGHEHSYAMYGEGAFGLNQGRLVGSSSYEASLHKDNPYDDKYPMVPYSSKNVILQTNSSYYNYANANDYYPHAGAIINMNQGNIKPTIDYYRFPSWKNGHPPTNPELVKITSETITDPKHYPLTTWRGDKRLHHDDIRSDRAPALSFADGKVFMAYKNTDDDDALWWDALNFNTETGEMWATNPQRVDNDSSPTATSSYPAMVKLGRKLYLVYRKKGEDKLKWCVYDLDENRWHKKGYVEKDNGDPFRSKHGVNMVVFQERIHLFFLDDEDEETIKWAISDGEDWIYLNDFTLNGYSVRSYHKICPAVAANETDLFLVYAPNENEKNLSLLRIDRSYYVEDIGFITNDNCEPFGHAFPETTETFRACADNKFLRILYRTSEGDEKHICLAVYSLGYYHDDGYWIPYNFSNNEKGSWSGGLPAICSNNSSIPNTQSFPGYCMNDGYSFMVYPNRTNEEFSTAIQRN